MPIALLTGSSIQDSLVYFLAIIPQLGISQPIGEAPIKFYLKRVLFELSIPFSSGGSLINMKIYQIFLKGQLYIPRSIERAAFE